MLLLFVLQSSAIENLFVYVTVIKSFYFLIAGDKPFNCEICQKKFALSCNLRAHLKTHEAEYQNSAASLALYRRALAALGSQDLAPNQEEDSPSFDEEEEDELLDIEDEPNRASGDDEDAADESRRSSSRTSNNNNNNNNNNNPLSDFSKPMTATA